MGFANVTALVEAEIEGRTNTVSFRKVPAVVTVQGVWYDYSMSPGNPSPQYYAAAPLVAQTLSRADGGINHGGNVSPSTKYLREILVSCVSAGGAIQRLYLLDYLMFYPFVDMGTTDPQTMTNVNVLTRYSDGEGVRMMAILVAPHGIVGDTFFVTYTNQDGVTDRVTPLHTMTTGATVNGTILTTQQTGVLRFGPFMTLQAGDTGVRSIEAVQCTAGTDVGLFTMVLVKPLAELTHRGIDAPVEKDFFLDAAGKLPVIVDDAYLNFIACPMGSLTSAPINGLFKYIWN